MSTAALTTLAGMPESAPAIFGPYAGIAQQYIFHYCRCHPEEIREKTA